MSVAPKAANESLVKAIAREEGKNHIRANSVLIGVIEAGMFLELSKQGVFDGITNNRTFELGNLNLAVANRFVIPKVLPDQPDHCIVAGRINRLARFKIPLL